MGTVFPILWKGQEVDFGVLAAGVGLALAVVGVTAGAESAATTGAEALSVVEGATLVDGALPPLKSVTYQPEPFN